MITTHSLYFFISNLIFSSMALKKKKSLKFSYVIFLTTVIEAYHIYHTLTFFFSIRKHKENALSLKIIIFSHISPPVALSMHQSTSSIQLSFSFNFLPSCFFCPAVIRCPCLCLPVCLSVSPHYYMDEKNCLILYTIVSESFHTSFP